MEGLTPLPFTIFLFFFFSGAFDSPLVRETLGA